MNVSPDLPAATKGPGSVFATLVEGLARFTNQNMIHPHEQWRDRDLSKRQSPPICVLACADSRVPPEIIFDRGLGDMFVVRVAGNIADEDDQASIEFAVQHFEPPPALILVMGHERCGAVTAATVIYDPHSVPEHVAQNFHKRGAPSQNLSLLVSRLRHAVENTRWHAPDPARWDERLDHAVMRNIRDNVAILRDNAVIGDSIRQHKTFVVGARYHLDNATVEWMIPVPAWHGVFGEMANEYRLEINASPDASGPWADAGTLVLDGFGAASYRRGTDGTAAAGVAIGEGYFDPARGRLVAEQVAHLAGAGGASIEVMITNGNMDSLYWDSNDGCAGWCLTGTARLKSAEELAVGGQILLRGRAIDGEANPAIPGNKPRV